MSDVYDYLAQVVTIIRDDPKLKECFNRVLAIGSSTQQVQAGILLKELEKLGAPEEVQKFVRLLGNDQLAQQVLLQINQ